MSSGSFTFLYLLALLMLVTALLTPQRSDRWAKGLAILGVSILVLLAATWLPAWLQ